MTRPMPGSQFIIILAVLALAAGVALMALMPPGVGAQGKPTCAEQQRSCTDQWGAHWFEELLAENHELDAQMTYQLPPTSQDFVTDGNKSIRLNSARMDFLVVAMDGGSGTRESSDLITGSRSVVKFNHDNPGERGRVHAWAVMNMTFNHPDRSSRTVDVYYNTDPSHVAYVNRNCDYNAPSTGYWRITYLGSAESGGRYRHHIAPGETNNKRCAATDWARAGVVYQAQVCRGGECTRPGLIGSRLGGGSLGDRKFNRGIERLDDGPRSTQRSYYVMEQNGNQTSQRSFPAELWEWLKDDYKDMEEYLLVTRQSGHSNEVSHALRGRDLDGFVTQ